MFLWKPRDSEMQYWITVGRGNSTTAAEVASSSISSMIQAG